MPYIVEQDKNDIAEVMLVSGKLPVAKTAGELNYLFTRLVNDYLQSKGLNYQHINDCVGALDGAKAEFQDRIVRPYENTKIKANGDAYDANLIEKANGVGG